MMSTVHLGEIAARAPDRPAVIMGGTGTTISFAELDERSNRAAQLFRARGLERGATVAIFLENHVRFLELAWAAQRSGLYYTAINSHLTPDEAAYIIDDCDARLVVSSAALSSVATAITAAAVPRVDHRLMVDAEADGWEGYEAALASMPPRPVADECEGDFMLYSSGTTGRPKGIQRPLTFAPLGQGIPGAVPFLQMLGVADGDVYLSPAPLYHAAPLAWSMGTHRLGATSVIMERFDPRQALALIERHRVTHAQFVPTMFVRMLKLPRAERERFDVSSLRAVVHAAAPCPVEVKRRMIDWWGPIISEYYSSTEGVGATFITADDWLAHPGSVGRPILGTPHILDDEGRELPPGEPGTIWFDGITRFEYHDDPKKTASMRNTDGWGTVGDMGYVDDEGYLYLTDRKSFMVISGGVNIYPQEVENLLVLHPKVMDVAAFGVPNADLGEEVKAVVQPVDWAQAGPGLAAELIAHCREHLAAYKCPRSIDFERELPRLDTGKLYKRLLRDRYWEAAG
jgi:acyl-CoA synthetase (AMP-forming)/AMP-acid ligase II